MSRRVPVTGARREAPRGAHTTVVCPGCVHTGPATGLRSPDPAPAPTAAQLIARGSITPERVFEQVVAAVDRRRLLVRTHREGRTAVRLERLLPRLVDGVIAKSRRRSKAMLDEQDRQEQHQ